MADTVFLEQGRDARPSERSLRFAAECSAPVHLVISRGGTGLAQALVRLVRAHPGTVYLLDLNVTTGLPALLYTRLSRTPLVLDFGDEVGAVSWNMGRWWLVCVMQGFLQRIAVRSADHVVVRSRMHAWLLRRRGASNVVVIEDGVDLARFPYRGRATKRARARLGFPEEGWILGVVGSLNYGARSRYVYGLEIVHALACLRDLTTYGLIVGSGSGLAVLRREATRLRVADRIAFVPFVKGKNIPLLLSCAQGWLWVQSHDAVGRVRTSGKLPLYLAGARRILGSRTGASLSTFARGRDLILKTRALDPAAIGAEVAGELRGRFLAEKADENEPRASASRFDYAALARRWRGFMETWGYGEALR